MTHSYILITIITVYFGLLISPANTSGVFELHITSPKTVLIEPTVCPNFECELPDDLAATLKVQEGVDYRFKTGQYLGEARNHIDVHLIVKDPITNDDIAREHFRLFANNEWSIPLIVPTSVGFNITFKVRNMCDNLFYGKRCGRYCVPSRERHWECSYEGERVCAAGWTGGDCSTPFCHNACNERGRCVSPNNCACVNGFNGTACEQCIPRVGCVHGECLNGIPNTCKCRDGYIGDKCNIGFNFCSTLNPCVNGGRCSIETLSPIGYRCECPFDFMGSTCAVPLSRVRCPAGDQICQNGGVCVSMNKRAIQCKCRPGFTGKFCELGASKNCSTKDCSEDYKISEEQMDDFNRALTVILVIICTFLFIAFFVLAYRLISVAYLLELESPIPTPSYKDLLDAEKSISSEEKEFDICLDRHSPPPPYSSPVMPRSYKSIPIDGDSLSIKV